ncbi:hypothetical protein SERLA73DRAFT_183688 [Serpula lacrymans var. lacrymans S7.3]|uniref:Uncharacterized protein n=2 Tax=Serpula lacrymans var. lacrymans TaxID=341189 RepID=F8Q3J7_SERL3|nr:uncharacterized protein SERLADRAFT_471002 [Serpula lacrymans var. lacrymans S7.9]EGN97082.1 hypothetical protein SERLA73DRAFT_183688 [Serpula lacrymans var. lacrymans S7.3]EGO22689.1 hypothetical protein SERLADRAFT_471002 [Serpula lacrymans var. lacrymans S7.9]
MLHGKVDNEILAALSNKFEWHDDAIQDLEQWALGKDAEYLDRIRARHLLTVAQEKLALQAGLATDVRGASLSWRDALGPQNELYTRLDKARSLLLAPTVQLDERTKAFTLSAAGMKLVTEVPSVIRARGDYAAHPRKIIRGVFQQTVDRHQEKEGLQVVLDFVCDD